MYICTRNTEVKQLIGAISSAGSEHPDSIGRVGETNLDNQNKYNIGAISSAGSEHPDSIGRVGETNLDNQNK